jgi:Transglutaminase-like superfamily
MGRVCRFLNLPPAERKLLMVAAILLCAVRLGLWCLPFRTLRRLLSGMMHPRKGILHANQCPADQIARAVAVASWYLPQATCLTQALSAHVLLVRRGFPALLHVGVSKDEGGRFIAHAWVECQGRTVIGGSARDDYTRLGTF